MVPLVPPLAHAPALITCRDEQHPGKRRRTEAQRRARPHLLRRMPRPRLRPRLPEVARIMTEFMPSEGMITRYRDSPWERLTRGQRVTITHGDWTSAEMRVTDVITHHDGDETYVLRDAAVTDAELEAERAVFTEALSSPYTYEDI